MRSSSPGGAISIAANTRRLDVDNRISLRNYYRIANNLIKQADIYREEKNIIDLYIILLRFSSLITETIPQHRDYKACLPGEKSLFKKKLHNILAELEVLKPVVKTKVEELNKKSRNQAIGLDLSYSNGSSLEWPPITKSATTLVSKQGQHSFGRYTHDALFHQNKYSQSTPLGDQLRKLSLNIPHPKEETLSRHSILGPNGLHGQWKPSTVTIKVEYPSNLDLTPISIPWTNSLQLKEEEPSTVKDSPKLVSENPASEAVLSVQDELFLLEVDAPPSMVVPDPIEIPAKLDMVRQLSPPPVLANVQDANPQLPVVSSVGKTNVLENELLRSENPLQVHISTGLMDEFMRFAKKNTAKNLETCGVLAGLLKNRKFYVTALIIPKQESTSDTCQTTNEEEIFDYQDKQSLFPLGWIHTHPTQSCFMSSVDVHTHYSYQVMLPEAIAIVMAPRDSSRPHGIFRLTTPGGMSVIRKCEKRGFHAHESPIEGSPIYEHCSDVYINPNVKFDVVDLR